MRFFSLLTLSLVSSESLKRINEYETMLARLSTEYFFGSKARSFDFAPSLIEDDDRDTLARRHRLEFLQDVAH